MIWLYLSNHWWHAGKGGTGDTWCFKDLRNGEEVAIKLIKRPLPKLLLQNITREFTVGFFGL
jgi:serine/threonine-protein kinase SRK2